MTPISEDSTTVDFSYRYIDYLIYASLMDSISLTTMMKGELEAK